MLSAKAYIKLQARTPLCLRLRVQVRFSLLDGLESILGLVSCCHYGGSKLLCSGHNVITVSTTYRHLTYPP